MLSPAKIMLALAAAVSLSSFARADLFIADGDRIGKYTDAGAVINANFISLDAVTGLALGNDGYLYAGTTIGDSGQPAIFRYDPASGAQIGSAPFVTYSGIATSPSNPLGMHFGPNNNLYVADGTENKVYIFDPAGTFVAAPGSITPAIVQPTGLTADANHAYVVGAEGVARYNPATNDFSDFVPVGTFSGPRDAAFGPDGNLYVLDNASDNDVLRFNAAGTLDPTFAIHLNDLFVSDGIAYQPFNINFGPDGRLDISGQDLFSAGGSVIQYDLAGNFQGFLIPSTSTLTFSDTFFLFTPVPEPATLALLLPGVLSLVRVRRRSS